MRDRPYTGLMPFSERQAPYFFGRDAERQIVSANLLASRLTVLYGPSGVGKSSLLNAGVASHLRRAARQNIQSYGEPEFSVIVFGAWRDHPATGLTRVVGQQVSEDIPGRLVEKLDGVSARLGCDLLIILDQFEEYFLYQAHEDARSGFAKEFAEAVNHSARTNFLISIREDALAKLDRFQGTIPSILGNRLKVNHLNLVAARDAIEKPLEEFNRLRSVDESAVTIENAVVEKVLQQVRAGRMARAASGDGVVQSIGRQRRHDRVETPYLQLVMTRLWDEEQRAGSSVMRVETLDRLGGAEKIVGTHLDEAMSMLTPNETEVAARIFNHLVTPSRTKIAHSVADLANYAGVTQGVLTPLLQTLSTGENRILVPVAPAPDETTSFRYQILHDILAGSVLDWRTRYVQNLERADAEAKAEEQRRRAEQEAFARKRLRKLSMLLLVMVCVASGFALVAVLQMRTAQARQLEAEAATLEAEAAKHTAQAGRLELEAAVKARTAAERSAELNRLEAEAARAELAGAREQAQVLRQRAAETKKQVDTAEAASVALIKEAQKERKSAASQAKRPAGGPAASEPPIDNEGIDRALQKYQAAYRALDLDALVAIYPRLPDDRRKHFKTSRSACASYDVTFSFRRRFPGAGDSVIAESQTSYQCMPKAGAPAQTFQVSEAFWLRKNASGAWIIDKVSAPLQ